MQQESSLDRGGFRLAEYAMAVFALAMLYITLAAGAYLGYQVLLAPGKEALKWDDALAEVLVILVGFVLSMGVISYSLRSRPPAFLKPLVILAGGLTAGGMLLVHGKMCAKALEQEYGGGKFLLHVGLLVAAAVALMLLEQLHSANGKRPAYALWYASALLFQEFLHFLAMVCRYVLCPPAEPWRVAYDLSIFVLAFIVALAMAGHLWKVVNCLAEKLTRTINSI